MLPGRNNARARNDNLRGFTAGQKLAQRMSIRRRSDSSGWMNHPSIKKSVRRRGSSARSISGEMDDRQTTGNGTDEGEEVIREEYFDALVLNDINDQHVV